MTKAEDQQRTEAIKGSAVAYVIFGCIEKIPHAARLYPDLYALAISEKVAELQDYGTYTLEDAYVVVKGFKYAPA